MCVDADQEQCIALSHEFSEVPWSPRGDLQPHEVHEWLPGNDAQDGQSK